MGNAICSVHRYPFLGSVDGHPVVDLAAMGDFPLPTAPSDAIRAHFKSLDRKPIAIEGFVYGPNKSSDRLGRFVLLNERCKHGLDGGPSHTAQQAVICTLNGGRTISDPGLETRVRVLGILHVGVQRDG